MKISVIVPIYNVEKYLSECLNSIINQTYENLEIILVNDGSTDKSLEICKRYEKIDSRIKIISKENGGLSSARNIGIKNASGEYISFVDSDDFIEVNTAYEDMYNIALEEKSDIVAGNAVWYWSQENKNVQPRDMSLFSYSPMMAEDFFLASLKSGRIYAPVWLNLYNKDLIINNNLYFKEGIYHEDEEFTPKALLKSNRVSIYNRNFYIYRQRNGSIINSFNCKKDLDKLNICINLEKEIKNIKNNELKIYFKNYITEIAIDIIYKCELKDISKEVKDFINRNAVRKNIKIRSNILNLNSSLYINLEKIYRKLRKIG